MAIPADLKTIRANLLVAIEAADGLRPVEAEALRRVYIPFVEYFAEVQLAGDGRIVVELTDATAAVAAAVIGHLHHNSFHPTLDRETVIDLFMSEVARRVRWSLVEQEVSLKEHGGRH